MLQWWRGGPDPPARLFTAGWPGGAARAGWLYLLYRGLVAATLLAGLVSSFLQESIGFLARGETENYNHLKYLVYLTNNGRVLAAVTSVLEAWLVARRWWRERRGKREEVEEVHCFDPVRLPASHRLLWVLANINCSISILISLVYWAALYDPTRHTLDFENFTGHLLISVFCLLDTLVGARPWRLLHAVHPILFGGVFGLFSVIFYLAGGTNYYGDPFIYFIIDWRKPGRSLLVICGVSLLLVVFHSCYYSLYRARLALVGRRSPAQLEDGVGARAGAEDILPQSHTTEQLLKSDHKQET